MAIEEAELLSSNEGYTADVEFVQDPTLKGLKAKLYKFLEKGYEPIEQNPFLDTTLVPAQWTIMMVLTEYGDEEK